MVDYTLGIMQKLLKAPQVESKPSIISISKKTDHDNLHDQDMYLNAF